MARYTGPKLKLSRREGTDLYHKSGVRPIDSKCKVDQPPGEHGVRRGRPSDYAVQLRENRRCGGSTECWRGSSATTTRRRTGRKAPPARICCACLKGGWTTWFTAWVLVPPGPKLGNWFPTSPSPSTARRVNIPSYQVSTGGCHWHWQQGQQATAHSVRAANGGGNGRR